MKWLPYDEETSMCSEYEYLLYKERFKTYYEPTVRVHSSVIKIIEKYYDMDISNVFIEIDGVFTLTITDEGNIRVVLINGVSEASILVGYYDEAFCVYVFDAKYNAKEHIANMAESVGATKV